MTILGYILAAVMLLVALTAAMHLASIFWPIRPPTDEEREAHERKDRGFEVIRRD